MRARDRERYENLLASDSNFEVYPLDPFSVIDLGGDFFNVLLVLILLYTRKIRPTSRIPPKIPPIIPTARAALEAFFRLLWSGTIPTANASLRQNGTGC